MTGNRSLDGNSYPYDLSVVELALAAGPPTTLLAWRQSVASNPRIPALLGEAGPGVEAVVADLFARFEVTADFFTDPTRTVLLAALAHRVAMTVTTPSEGEVALREDLTFLLFRNYSPLLKDLSDVYDFAVDGAQVDPATKLAVYDRFTNREMSERVVAALPEILAEVRERVGTSVAEEGFDLRVLNIAADTHTLLMAPSYNDDPEAYLLNRRLFNDYERGLFRNMADMCGALGAPPLGAAWVTDVGGRPTINVTLPTAEKILDPESFRPSWRSDTDHKRDVADNRALFAHEFVHTQGSMTMEKQTDFGILLEERRAELLSGDHHGYGEVKGFVNDFAAMTGLNVTRHTPAHPTAVSRSETLLTIAETVGWNAMLEVAIAQPRNYCVDDRLRARVMENLGGLDGILGRLLESQVAAGNGEDVGRRLLSYADAVKRSGGPGAVERYAGFRQAYGLHLVGELLLSLPEDSSMSASATVAWDGERWTVGLSESHAVPSQLSSVEIRPSADSTATRGLLTPGRPSEEVAGVTGSPAHRGVQGAVASRPTSHRP